MDAQLRFDMAHQDELLEAVSRLVQGCLGQLDRLPAAVAPPPPPDAAPVLPLQGMGAAGALAYFQSRILPFLSASPGPRYLGFVTGGVTPAALLGDWLAAAVDQNVTADFDSIAPRVEDEVIDLLRQLFDLPASFSGAFVSGATMASFAGLALGREWLGRRAGVEVAREGIQRLGPVRVLAGTPHASIYKALAMLGLGRESLHKVRCLPGREAIDPQALAQALGAAAAEAIPCLVVGSGGTVNSVDFDDLRALGQLQERFDFWYHVDAAFGGFAACSPRTRHLTDGMALADSVTIDAHKWLNVPYDSAMFFSRHPALQTAVFQNAAAYLGEVGDEPAYVHRTPQNSRRFRALPAWFTLQAYGRSGYREIVERCGDLALRLGERIERSAMFALAAPIHLNVVCFTTRETAALPESDGRALIDRLVLALRDDGRVFMTPTWIGGRPAIRAAFSSWRTAESDLDLIWPALTEAYERAIQPASPRSSG